MCRMGDQMHEVSDVARHVNLYMRVRSLLILKDVLVVSTLISTSCNV